ncbi:MAG: hypothetical protein Q9163_001688 [Psora crenata]
MKIKSSKLGHWVPQDHKWTQKWLSNLIEHVDKHEKDLRDELREFEELVEGDVSLKILAAMMFTEVPEKEPYCRDPTQQPQVRDFHHMLMLINDIMDSAPQWSTIADEVGLIGFPINAILDWPMGTSSGNAFFLRREVNEQWVKVLNRWAVFLGTPQSASVLTENENGWLNENAIEALSAKGNIGVTNYSFEELYVCDKSVDHYGFKTWDDFFVRPFRDGVRPLGAPVPKAGEPGDPVPAMPIGGPSNDPSVGATIYNACESTPFCLARNNDVGEKTKFWLKDQPYSLAEMLGNDPFTPQFVQGTVYQAFLSALSYHRWHSPVSGTIVRAFNIPGTYYSANYFEGFANPEDGPDPAAPNNSQTYIAQVAARAVIFIQADEPDIGLMAFVAIGMCECSSNEVTVAEGQKIKAGEQIGMFHFGGSTHCLLFRKGVDLVFAQEPNKGTKYDPPPEHNTALRAAIATVKKPLRA